MTIATVNQLLTIYNWFPIAILLTLLLMIGRFYQKLTGENTHYRWFVLPILLFGAAAVHFARLNQVLGNPLGDLLLFVGGVVFIWLCVLLYHRMTQGR
jgi:hypothetical protein